jgi:hypothetical protein
MTDETTNTKIEEPKKKSNKWLKIVGIIVLVLVLAGGAFIGGMWMVGQATGMNDVMDPEVFTATLVNLEQTPATAPAMAGVVVELADNSVYVSTASSTGAFAHSPGAEMVLSPPIEVVIDRNTAVLADVTAMDFDFSNIFAGGGNLELNTESEGMEAFAEGTTRTIEQGSLEDMETNQMIWIWGERNGDRIDAEAILYIVLPFSM